MSTITPGAVYPILAASDYDVTPAYSGTFIPTLWSNNFNVKFYASTTFGAIANTNWEGEISGYGDKIIIRDPPEISITPHKVGEDITYEVPTINTQELVIDTGFVHSFQCDDVLKQQSDVEMMGLFSDHAGQRLKTVVDTECWLNTFDQSAAANKGATAGAISGNKNMGTDAAPVVVDKTNILTKIMEMATILDEQNVPDEGRWLVLTPEERLLLLQTDLAAAYYSGDTTSMVRNGKLGTIDRFQIYGSNLMPRALADEDFEGGADAGTAKRHAVMAGHSSALTFAGTFTKTEQIRHQNQFVDLIRGLMIYGKKCVKPEAMVTMLAAG